MPDRKMIAVVGATGAQGGGLVRAIINEPAGGFAVRALTRDTQSAKAKQLTSLGVEVVSANLDDVDSVKRAFGGCYGAFCLTNFWEHFSPEKELIQVLARCWGRAHAGHWRDARPVNARN